MENIFPPALIVAALILIMWWFGSRGARQYRDRFMAYIAQSETRFAEQMKATAEQTKALERIAVALERRNDGENKPS
jgi:hypothetical protein